VHGACAMVGVSGARGERRGSGAAATDRRTTVRWRNAIVSPHRRLHNEEEGAREREKEEQPTSLPWVGCDQGGALDGCGRPRVGTAEWPHRWESEA
jgi:hypothetical protein